MTSWHERNFRNHYGDVIMTTIASQITSLSVVYSIVYSDADQRKHQSSASLAFVWGIHRSRWIPHTKGQLRGKCFHLMTSSCSGPVSSLDSHNNSGVAMWNFDILFVLGLKQSVEQTFLSTVVCDAFTLLVRWYSCCQCQFWYCSILLDNRRVQYLSHLNFKDMPAWVTALLPASVSP